MAGPDAPLLTPGDSYEFRLVDGYVFSAVFDYAEVETNAHAAALVVSVSGRRGWVNPAAIATIWEFPRT